MYPIICKVKRIIKSCQSGGKEVIALHCQQEAVSTYIPIIYTYKYKINLFKSKYYILLHAN